MLSNLPRGWHRSAIGRWLLVVDGRAAALVARLRGGPGGFVRWNWRLATRKRIGWWWGTEPDRFELCLEAACKTLRDGSDLAASIDPEQEREIIRLWKEVA